MGEWEGRGGSTWALVSMATFIETRGTEQLKVCWISPYMGIEPDRLNLQLPIRPVERDNLVSSPFEKQRNNTNASRKQRMKQEIGNIRAWMYSVNNIRTRYREALDRPLPWVTRQVIPLSMWDKGDRKRSSHAIICCYRLNGLLRTWVQTTQKHIRIPQSEWMVHF